jgi:hypothetical protein
MTTLVTFFYDIGRDSWSSYPRKAMEYINSFDMFLNYEYKMIIFIDDRYYDILKERVLKSKYPETKKLIPINENWFYENIWAWSRLEKEKAIMNSQKYKHLLIKRIENNYPENINPHYTILTHSKIDVVNYAIDSGLIEDDYVGWVDFGYFHNKSDERFIPNSVIDENKLDKERVNLCLINPIDDNDKGIVYTLLNAPEKIGAYFFWANKENMKEFQTLCHNWLDAFQTMEFADDEQGVWLQCFFENTNLFKCHVFYAWHKALKEFSR